MFSPPPVGGLVSRWGSCTSAHWRSLQLFWLSLHKHTDKCWVEGCRVCFYPVPTHVFIPYFYSRIFMRCAERSKGGLLAGGWLAVPEHPHPFCPAVADTSKAAARQSFVFFLDFFYCTEDLGRETLLCVFFFQWGNTAPLQCCVFYSSSRLLFFCFFLSWEWISYLFSGFCSLPSCGSRNQGEAGGGAALENVVEERGLSMRPCVLPLHCWLLAPWWVQKLGTCFSHL